MIWVQRWVRWWLEESSNFHLKQDKTKCHFLEPHYMVVEKIMILELLGCISKREKRIKKIFSQYCSCIIVWGNECNHNTLSIQAPKPLWLVFLFYFPHCLWSFPPYASSIKNYICFTFRRDWIKMQVITRTGEELVFTDPPSFTFPSSVCSL